jgi:hypothetical protein
MKYIHDWYQLLQLLLYLQLYILLYILLSRALSRHETGRLGVSRSRVIGHAARAYGLLLRRGAIERCGIVERLKSLIVERCHEALWNCGATLSIVQRIQNGCGKSNSLNFLQPI